MQKRARPPQTNDERPTVPSASKKSRTNSSNLFAIPEDVRHHRIAVFLDNKTLAAYAVTHKVAL
ncbi:MAG: hypothetical protein K0S11_431 [Gammaproteobacteria bacterium]|jgi:hypothetical protein|nr:hypothetical protein [Gammaproteobacteria bacterium]